VVVIRNILTDERDNNIKQEVHPTITSALP